MSKEIVGEILTKVITDKGYRRLLFSNTDETLAGYDLTERETSALKKIDRVTFDTAAAAIEDRVLKTGEDPSGIETIMFHCDAVHGSSFVQTLNLSNLYAK